MCVLTRRFTQNKLGFWVWVWIPKLKNPKQTNTKPKPKTQRNSNEIVWFRQLILLLLLMCAQNINPFKNCREKI